MWWLLWTRPSDQDRVLVGMLSLHIHHVDEGLSNDRLVGVVHDGWHAATFENTHGRRSVAAGLERVWHSVERGPVQAMVGLRAGFMYGYDNRLGWAAEIYPVLPFAQPVLYGRIGPVTLDVTHTWVVSSLLVGIRF